MKKIKKIISLFSISMLILFLPNGCQQEESNQELRIGLVSPLTGSSASSGVIQQNAAKMAVDEINAAGGIGGKAKIKLISEDDEGLPAKSITATQKLVSEDKIQVMIGALNSSCTLADMEVTKRAKIPQLAPCSTAATITQQRNQYIFRNVASDKTHIATLFKYATGQLHAKKISILYESSDFGTGGQKIITNKAKELGIEVTASEMYNIGDKDFSAQLTKIKNTNTDVIFLYGYYSEAALICKQISQYGIKIPIIGTGYNSPKLIELGGDAINGLIFSTSFTAANPDEKVQNFVKEYEKLYNEHPDQNAAQVYDAVYIVAEAVKNVGVDSEKIRDYIANIKDFPGVAGVTNFDKNGDVVKDLILVKLENKKQVIVKY